MLVFLVVFSAGGWLFISRDDSLARHRNNGVIRIGYAVEAPFAFVNPNGDVTGESPEVAREITSRLGIARIQWIQTDFNALIPTLLAGRFDVIAAGMFITPERARRIGFSEPTFWVRQGLLVHTGNPRRIDSYEQAAAQAGTRIAVVSGAVEEKLLQHLGVTGSRLVCVPDALTGRTAVETGLADGLALSSPTIRWMSLHDELGKTEIARPFTPPDPALAQGLGYGAFAFRRNDRSLMAAWNTALKPYIGSPDHRALVAKFGFTEAELPGKITTRDILSHD